VVGLAADVVGAGVPPAVEVGLVAGGSLDAPVGCGDGVPSEGEEEAAAVVAAAEVVIVARPGPAGTVEVVAGLAEVVAGTAEVAGASGTVPVVRGAALEVVLGRSGSVTAIADAGVFVAVAEPARMPPRRRASRVSPASLRFAASSAATASCRPSELVDRDSAGPTAMARRASPATARRENRLGRLDR
jgi:hypothetical protein